MDGRRPRSLFLGFGAAWAAGLVALLLASRGFGLVWDETIYFDFSDAVRRWAGGGFSFDRASLDAHWNYSSYHNPHPPFFKVLSAVSSALLAGRLPFPLEYRLPHLAVAAAGLAAVWAALSRRFSAGAAAAAVAAAALQPRVFGDLLVACTDGPVLIAWLALPVLLWAWEREEDPVLRRSFAVAYVVMQACGAAAKITGLLPALPLALHCAAMRRRKGLALVCLAAVIGLAAAVFSSPADWAHPFRAGIDYLSYPFERKDIPIDTYYLGKVFNGGGIPWHYVAVMSAVTFPPVLLASLPGVFLAGREERGLLSVLAAPLLFWTALAFFPGLPRHDGVRQFSSLFPLLGLAAWAGWEGLRARALARWPMSAATAGLLRFFPAACLTAALWRVHPFELSYYNAPAGGLPGAERRGLELTYWLEPAGSALDWLNRNAEPGSRASVFPLWPDLLERYKKQGLLRGDISLDASGSWTGPEYMVLCRRRSLVDDGHYVAAPAVHEVLLEGVSLAKVLRRVRK